MILILNRRPSCRRKRQELHVHQLTFQIKQDKLRRNKEVSVSILVKLDPLKFAPFTEADTTVRRENIVNETAYHFVGFANSLANQVTEYRT